MYSLNYSKKALKELKKLDTIMCKRVISSLERCRIRPYAHVKKLVDSPYFRLRIGDYRVIINIQDNQLRILVIEMGHRKNIY